MPSLSVEAQQRLECDPESWESRWAEQVTDTDYHSMFLMTDIRPSLNSAAAWSLLDIPQAGCAADSNPVPGAMA